MKVVMIAQQPECGGNQGDSHQNGGAGVCPAPANGGDEDHRQKGQYRLANAVSQ